MSLREIDVPSFLTKSKLNGEIVEVFILECFSAVYNEVITFHWLKAFLSRYYSIIIVNLYI